MAFLRAARQIPRLSSGFQHIPRFGRVIGMDFTSVGPDAPASVPPPYNKITWIGHFTDAACVGPRRWMSSETKSAERPFATQNLMFQKRLMPGVLKHTARYPMMLQRHELSWFSNNIQTLKTKAKAASPTIMNFFKLVLQGLKKYVILFCTQFSKWFKAKLSENYWKTLIFAVICVVTYQLEKMEKWLAGFGDGPDGGIAKISRMLMQLVQLLKFLQVEIKGLMGAEIEQLKTEISTLRADLDTQLSLSEMMFKHMLNVLKELGDELASQQKSMDELEARVSQLARLLDEFEKIKPKE